MRPPFDLRLRHFFYTCLLSPAFWVIKWLMLLALGFYQCVVRSHLWVGQCRFTPTCSDYSRLVIARFGPLKGFWLTLRRLKKCHPWGDRPRMQRPKH